MLKHTPAAKALALVLRSRKTLFSVSLAALGAVLLLSPSSFATEQTSYKPIIVIHGGCGIERAELKPDEEIKHKKALSAALQAGYSILKMGGTAVDAVEAAVKFMEDSRDFNAGAGAVFDRDGHNTLDAAIMDGKSHEAGAVAGVTIVKNPISAAYTVMHKSPHVLLIGEGANKFSKEQGLEIVAPSYFHTQKNYDKLQKFLEKERNDKSKKSENVDSDHKYGTVGAVALDKAGNLAAATSTGGLTGKRWGRVGDSPIIGAGTYADNDSCAVSCTGEGEWFIRFHVASDISSRVKYQSKSIETATKEVIHGVLGPGHGEGAAIVLDRNGNFVMAKNTEGLYRGYMYDDTPHTFIFEDDTVGKVVEAPR